MRTWLERECRMAVFIVFNNLVVATLFGLFMLRPSPPGCFINFLVVLLLRPWSIFLALHYLLVTLLMFYLFRAKQSHTSCLTSTTLFIMLYLILFIMICGVCIHIPPLLVLLLNYCGWLFVRHGGLSAFWIKWSS